MEAPFSTPFVRWSGDQRLRLREAGVRFRGLVEASFWTSFVRICFLAIVTNPIPQTRLYSVPNEVAAGVACSQCVAV